MKKVFFEEILTILLVLGLGIVISIQQFRGCYSGPSSSRWGVPFLIVGILLLVDKIIGKDNFKLKEALLKRNKSQKIFFIIFVTLSILVIILMIPGLYQCISSK